MPNRSNQAPESSRLRDQAEAELSQRHPEVTTVSHAEAQRLLHELQVHQVELELQNEELRRRQLELQIARDKYEALYDLAPVGYVTLDAKGTILEANLAAATMLGVPRRDLMGTPLTRFTVSDDQDAFYLHRRKMFEADSQEPCDLSLKRPDGTTFVACLESRPIPVAGGQAQQCLTILSDISARQLAEAAQRQTERLASLGTFAAGLAHELNNPLYAITSTVEHVRDSFPKAQSIDEIDECLAEILSDANRCAQIVRRVLNFARQGHRDKVPLDLHPLIQAAHDLTQRYAEQQGVPSRLALAQAQPRIVANREDIELVLVNLIRNAVEASPDRGQIAIETTVAAEQVQIQVRDIGVGLSDEAQQQVFDPFYTTRQESGGSGLGLSLTHRIIVDHGGSIELQSAPGQGTTVCVRLPLAQPEAIPTA